MESPKRLNVFMDLNVSLYKETIGERSDLCNPAVPSSWQLKLNATLRHAFPKQLNELINDRTRDLWLHLVIVYVTESCWKIEITNFFLE